MITVNDLEPLRRLLTAELPRPVLLAVIGGVIVLAVAVNAGKWAERKLREAEFRECQRSWRTMPPPVPGRETTAGDRRRHRRPRGRLYWRPVGRHLKGLSMRTKPPPRHAAPRAVRSPGPVTMGFRALAWKPRHPVASAALRTWPAVPALALIWPALHGSLLLYADQVLGFDATLALIACLAVTPVITVVRAPVARLRWWYGNWVFLLGAAGLAIHLAYPPGAMAWRSSGTAVEWTGTLIVALLLPMAVTSSVAAQRLLGPEWKRWQRNLIWLVWACVGIHLALMEAWLVTGAYLGATLPAVLVRRPFARKGIRAWRADGYSTGGWWAVMAVLVSLALAGVAVLTGEEVRAVARAVRLAP